MKRKSFSVRTKYVKMLRLGGIAHVVLFSLCFSPELYAHTGSGIEKGVPHENYFQQTRKIQGVVTDDTGQPLVGVYVQVKGTQTGTTTDLDGKYEIKVADDPALALEFSFMGMATQEIKIGQLQQISVKLLPEQNLLEEVMVVAYGTTKKEAFTGSATSVKGDKLIQAAASKTSAVQALQGNVAGVRFSSSDGQPGDVGNIQIRGIGSLNESTSPLYIVDGVAISSGLNMVNPNDIESMTVLKDAAATSLYGNRASNGVIIITTKKGSEGKMKVAVTYEHAWSSQTMANNLKGFYMNTEELTNYSMEALKNRYLYNNNALPWQSKYDPNNTAIVEKATKDALSKLKSSAKLIHPDDPLDGTFDYTKADMSKYLTNPRMNNWEDAIFRVGEENKLNLSLTGGNQAMNYYASLGYLNQKGIVVGSEYERFTGSIALNGKIGKYIDFSLSERVGYSIKDEQTESSSSLYYSNAIYGIGLINPSQPIYLNDGTLNPTPGYNNNIPNYVANLTQVMFGTKQLSSISNLALTVNFTKWLNFKTVNGVDLNYIQQKTTWTPESNDGKNIGGRVKQYGSMYNRLTTSNTLNFNKSFDKHNVSALVGYEASKYNYDNFSGTGQQFAYGYLMYLGNAAVPSAVGGTAGTDRMVSLISKADYNYANKYYLSGSFRRDGTSRFTQSNRWGNFWSVSGAWNITREPFMKSTENWLDNLRLKLSYGTNGNQPENYFNSLTLFSVTGKHNMQAASIADSYGNPLLTWENSYTWNTGIDFSIFKGVLKGSVEYYNRLTTDLIDWTNVSYLTGWSKVIVNDGKLRNTGVEITLNSRNFSKKDFTWTTDFNISYMRAKVEELKGGARISHPHITMEGENIYSFYTREWVGVDPATGQGIWKLNTKDAQGNVIDSEGTTNTSDKADRVIVGKGYPDWFGGLTNTLTYKGFELSFLFTFTLGGQMWDNTHYNSARDGYNLGNQNFRKDAGENYWQKPGDQATNPIVISGNPLKSSENTSTRRMISSDHLRLKNLTFAYNLPKQWLNKVGLSGAKIYVNGNDVLTFSKSKYIDPEVGMNGMSKPIDGWPMLKSWRIGINVQL